MVLLCPYLENCIGARHSTIGCIICIIQYRAIENSPLLIMLDLDFCCTYDALRMRRLLVKFQQFTNQPYSPSLINETIFKWIFCSFFRLFIAKNKSANCTCDRIIVNAVNAKVTAGILSEGIATLGAFSILTNWQLNVFFHWLLQEAIDHVNWLHCRLISWGSQSASLKEKPL